MCGSVLDAAVPSFLINQAALAPVCPGWREVAPRTDGGEGAVRVLFMCGMQKNYDDMTSYLVT